MSTQIKYEKHETILKVENVSLKLQNNLILRDINLEVKNIVRPGMTQGQVIGLLAPSGMGKTQFFEVLSGLKPPTTGQVLIDNPLRPVKVGQVGVVAQNYPLFPQYTIRGNLMLAAKRHKTDSEDLRTHKVDEMLNLFQIMDHADSYPALLSGGQRQRVAIAQQVLCSDHYLLMDEPFSGLDPLMIRKACDLITTIADRDDANTIIVITHDIAAAATICDTLWILGHDKDARGNNIPGATVKAVYDLIEIGIALRGPEVEYTPEFVQLVKEIKGLFAGL